MHQPDFLELKQTIKRKWKPLLVIPFSIVLIYVVFISGKEKKANISQFVEADNLTETGYDVVITYTESGNIKAKVFTPELTRFVNQSGVTEFKKGLKIFFFDSNGKSESNMSARYGKAFEKEEELLAKDSVVIVNTKGEQLNTEELIWKRKEKKIYSNKFVKITTADEIIFGDGLEANEDFSSYVIKKVKGTIKVDAKEY